MIERHVPLLNVNDDFYYLKKNFYFVTRILISTFVS